MSRQEDASAARTVARLSHLGPPGPIRPLGTLGPTPIARAIEEVMDDIGRSMGLPPEVLQTGTVEDARAGRTTLLDLERTVESFRVVGNAAAVSGRTFQELAMALRRARDPSALTAFQRQRALAEFHPGHQTAERIRGDADLIANETIGAESLDQGLEEDPPEFQVGRVAGVKRMSFDEWKKQSDELLKANEKIFRDTEADDPAPTERS